MVFINLSFQNGPMMLRININEKFTHFANQLRSNKHKDCLSSPDVQTALRNLHKNFVIIPVDNATGNIDLVWKRFCASVITK